MNRRSIITALCGAPLAPLLPAPPLMGGAGHPAPIESKGNPLQDALLYFRAHRNVALRENEILLDEDAPLTLTGVWPDDDHVIHVQIHRAAMIGPSQEGAYNAIRSHIAEHEHYLSCAKAEALFSEATPEARV